MVKGRQFVARIDDDLAEVMERTADDLARSRAVILCTSLMLFAELSPKEREAAVRRYLERAKARRRQAPPK